MEIVQNHPYYLVEKEDEKVKQRKTSIQGKTIIAHIVCQKKCRVTLQNNASVSALLERPQTQQTAHEFEGYPYLSDTNQNLSFEDNTMPPKNCIVLITNKYRWK